MPLVLQFHGYPGASRSFAEQASFAGMGMALIAMDCPGQAGYSEDVGGFLGTTVSGHIIAGLDGPPERMYYVRLHQNIRILCRLVRELDGIDTSRVFVNGGSQGGGLGLACAALNPELIDRAAILYPFLSDFKLVWDLGADEIAYEGLRYYARWFDADEHQQDRWFRQLGYIDSKNFAPMIHCPVLFGTGLDDVICRRRPSATCTTICTAPGSGISSLGTDMRRSRNLTICCWTFSPARRLCYDHHRAKGIFAQLHRAGTGPR